MTKKLIQVRKVIGIEKDVFLSFRALCHSEGRTHSAMLRVLLESYMNNGEMKK